MKTWQLLKQHPELWSRYFIREKVMTGIRRFFLDREFHEVETPYLTGSLPPESYLDVFETTLLSRDRTASRAFLPTSPEPFLKKLLVAGIGNCFAMPKSFRNTEDKSTTHNPEFTILEWYRVDADYTNIMADCEELLVFINTYLQRHHGEKGKSTDPFTVVYQGKSVNLSSPWERISVREACKKYAHFDLDFALYLKSITPIAKRKGYTVTDKDTWEELFNQIYLNEVVPKFAKDKPTIIYDYPLQLAALAAKSKDSNPRFVERFEVYIGGIELSDGCTELTDLKKQEERFAKEIKESRKLGKTEFPIDNEFLEALRLGLPPCAGVALGVDRLIMLFADVDDISKTMFFPRKDLFDTTLDT